MTPATDPDRLDSIVRAADPAAGRSAPPVDDRPLALAALRAGLRPPARPAGGARTRAARPTTRSVSPARPVPTAHPVRSRVRGGGATGRPAAGSRWPRPWSRCSPWSAWPRW